MVASVSIGALNGENVTLGVQKLKFQQTNVFSASVGH